MSVRVRLTATAVLVVGSALVAGAVVLVALLSSALTDRVCATARERATAIAARPGTVVTTPGETARDEIVRFARSDGTIITSGDGAAVPDSGEGAGVSDPGAGCRTTEIAGYDDDYAVVAEPVAEPSSAIAAGGAARVIVAMPVADVLDSTGFVTRALAIGLPVVLMLVGATTWVVAGRVLAPVTAIRREVDGISATELHRRVPQPRTQDEIGRLSATMNRMLDRLERAQRSQRRFVSDASHELRSPVASIRQHAEVALAHPDRTTTAELAGTVLAENLRIQQLVDDLLLLARADERRLTVPDTPVDLDDLVFEEAKQLRETTALRIDTSAVSAGRVRGDADALRRVLRNLGDNAARHARTRIAFTLSERRGNVVMAVSDDGPGVPEGERERVFERFVRLAEARSRDDGGSGLGLAIVAELVGAPGGSVRVGDGPLGGARFEVTLPAADG